MEESDVSSENAEKEDEPEYIINPGTNKTYLKGHFLGKVRRLRIFYIGLEFAFVHLWNVLLIPDIHFFEYLASP